MCAHYASHFILQELELALNEITPDGAAAVAACVAAKPALRRLNLRENELEDEGAVTIAKVGREQMRWSRLGTSKPCCWLGGIGLMGGFPSLVCPCMPARPAGHCFAACHSLSSHTGAGQPDRPLDPGRMLFICMH